MDSNGCVCRILELLFVIRLISGLRGEPAPAPPREYCLDEAFQADCSANEVVVIEEAKYGRMKVGNCVSRNYGYIGCANDVTDALAWHCSGRQNCRIDNIATAFQNLQKKCPRDFNAYLEASFRCLQVESDLFDECPLLHYLHLSKASGYLSSALAHSRGYGTRKCPWVIQAQPGQYINLTLHDFTHDDPLSEKLVDQETHTSYCREYAIIKEKTELKNVERCHGDTRSKSVYLSLSHRVEVELLPPGGDSVPHYVFSYEVLGCPYPQPPPDAYIVPVGPNELQVKCNHTGETWTFKCHQGAWEGEAGNCTIVVPEDKKEVAPTSLLPYGISVIIIFAVAVLICLTILSIGILHLKRRRRHNRTYEPQNLGVYPTMYRSASCPSSPTTKLATIQRSPQYGPCQHGYHPMTRANTLRAVSRDGKYAHIWELRTQIPSSGQGEAVTCCAVATATPSQSGTISPQQTPLTQTPDSSTALVKKCTCAPPNAANKLNQEPDVIQEGQQLPKSFSTFKPNNQSHVYESPLIDGKTLVKGERIPIRFELDSSKLQRLNNATCLENGSI